MGKIEIKKCVLGMVRTNCYLLMDSETKEAIFIDPADEAGTLIKEAERLGAAPVGILLTHGHFDHIGAAKALADRYQIEIFAGSGETGVLGDPGKNLSAQFGRGFTLRPDRLLRDGEEISMAGFRIWVMHTPGHTEGGVCYYLPEEGVLFSGDTLFCESVGRSDFPTGSMAVLVRSVKGLIAELPDDTRICPGHEAETTIAHEKEFNPFI